MEKLTIIKNDSQPDKNSVSETESFLDSDNIFIVQIKNYNNQVGYAGEENGKKVIISRICHLVKKFKDYTGAKKFANTFTGSEKTVIGKNKIIKLIAEQDGGVTIPVDKVQGEMYHVIVKDKKSGEGIGYISYKPQKDEYSVIKSTENAAFWESQEKAALFIIEANKSFFGNQPELELETLKYK